MSLIELGDLSITGNLNPFFGTVGKLEAGQCTDPYGNIVAYSMWDLEVSGTPGSPTIYINYRDVDRNLINTEVVSAPSMGSTLPWYQIEAQGSIYMQNNSINSVTSMNIDAIYSNNNQSTTLESPLLYDVNSLLVGSSGIGLGSLMTDNTNSYVANIHSACPTASTILPLVYTPTLPILIGPSGLGRDTLITGNNSIGQGEINMFQSDWSQTRFKITLSYNISATIVTDGVSPVTIGGVPLRLWMQGNFMPSYPTLSTFTTQGLTFSSANPYYTQSVTTDTESNICFSGTITDYIDTIFNGDAVYNDNFGTSKPTFALDIYAGVPTSSRAIISITTTSYSYDIQPVIQTPVPNILGEPISLILSLSNVGSLNMFNNIVLRGQTSQTFTVYDPLNSLAASGNPDGINGIRVMATGHDFSDDAINVGVNSPSMSPPSVNEMDDMTLYFNSPSSYADMPWTFTLTFATPLVSIDSIQFNP